MSEPVNQINHAEVIRKALDTGGHAHRCGVEWSYACSCGAEPKIEAGYASLAAMQKELEAYQTAQPDLRRQFIEKEATITAQAERIARLEEALQGLMAGCHYRDIQGDLDWHERTIPTKDALNFARAALAAARLPLDPPPTP